MGKLSLHNITAVKPGQVQLKSVNVNEAVHFVEVLTYVPGTNLKPIQAGVYVRVALTMSDFAHRQPEKWQPFVHMNTGEVRMLPTWIAAESVDMSCNFKRSK